MLGFIALLVLIFVFVRFGRIEDRLRKIEESLGISVAESSKVIPIEEKIPPMPSEASAPAPTQERAAMASDSLFVSEARGEKKKMDLEHFFGVKFFSVLGVVSIVLAVGFFTMWAFANNLVGPLGRVIIGIIFSLVCLVLGELSRKKYPKFFYVVSAAGIAGLIISTYVARVNYELIAPLSSMIFYSLEVGLGLFLSLRYDSRFLGNFSVLGGLLAPLLVNPSEPNPIGLLYFLCVLCVAGFFVALKRNWEEIGVILFIGVVFFEIGIMAERLLTDSPGVLITFIWILHLLIGFGAIAKLFACRVIKNTECVESNDENSAAQGIGTFLFASSIVLANFLMGAIFNQQDWSHFGYWILFEGVVLGLLSELFRRFKMGLVSNVSLVLSIIFVVLATIFEIDHSQKLALTLTLLLEGLVLYYVGFRMNKKVLSVMGQFVILISSISFFNIDKTWETTVGFFAVVLGLIASVRNSKSEDWESFWKGVVIFMTSICVVYWNFEVISDLVTDEKYNFLIFIAPVVWAGLLSFSAIKTKGSFSNASGLMFMILVNIIAVGFISDSLDTSYYDLILMLVVLLGNFLVLSSFFVLSEYVSISESLRKMATIITLGFSSLLVLVSGIEIFDEPMRTIFWIIWGGVLMLVGFVKDWRHFRYFGIYTFVFLILKIYLVDVWGWQMWARFSAFMAIGVALLIVAFFYHKKNTD